MYYVDIHNHALFGLDDGPKNAAGTRRMLDEAYAQGTRVICFTPHFHPGIFPVTDADRESAFRTAQSYAREKYPDLALHLGCELHYSRNCMSWFEQSRYGCIDGKKYVLVDFSTQDAAERIINGLHDLMNHGYRPILAHAERYRYLPVKQIRGLRQKGILIQTDTQSLLGGFGLTVKFRANQMLREDLIDIVSSDAHDCTRRPVDMDACCQLIKRKKGAAYAEALCASNARLLLYNM